MSKRTANEALNFLIDGNARFVSGVRSVETFLGNERLPELAKLGQSPFAIVLCCSDSRVPAEIVFDRGLGDLFVVRVAGNVVAPSLIASVEFAASSFGTPLVVVMGHSECGAIKAAQQETWEPNPSMSFNLRDLVDKITPAIREVEASVGSRCSPSEKLMLSTWANVRHSLSQLRTNSDILAAMESKKQLTMVGAVFDLHTGLVEFDLPRERARPESVIARSLPATAGAEIHA